MSGAERLCRGGDLLLLLLNGLLLVLSSCEAYGLTQMSSCRQCQSVKVSPPVFCSNYVNYSHCISCSSHEIDPSLPDCANTTVSDDRALKIYQQYVGDIEKVVKQDPLPDDCLDTIKRMSCFSSFPDCHEHHEHAFVGPCQKTCLEMVKACRLEETYFRDNCYLTWQTYDCVEGPAGSDAQRGWNALPEALQVFIIVASVLTGIILLFMCGVGSLIAVKRYEIRSIQNEERRSLLNHS
ncbi:hypothetical protein QOT17_001064 [Balamuthia mandrillaris]